MKNASRNHKPKRGKPYNVPDGWLFVDIFHFRNLVISVTAISSFFRPGGAKMIVAARYFIISSYSASSVQP